MKLSDAQAAALSDAGVPVYVRFPDGALYEVFTAKPESCEYACLGGQNLTHDQARVAQSVGVLLQKQAGVADDYSARWITDVFDLSDSNATYRIHHAYQTVF